MTYSGKNDSANAVVPRDNGGLQLLTTIESNKAPTEYTYAITVPQGGKIILLEGGAAATVNADGISTGIFVSPAWAKDANGKAVKSWFTTDGKTLTQHVAHKARGVTYPVVADPDLGYIIWALLRCGAGGAVAWVTAIPFPWVMWARALWVAGGCILAIP